MPHEHAHDHGLWTHDHHFLGHTHGSAERRARAAALLTAVFMLVEIVAGLWFGSMALLADGVHMATHVGALGLAALAYGLARSHVANERFTFGSGKFGDLAAFTSAIVLTLIAIGVAVESARRLLWPVPINYASALPIAALGFCVNVASALILRDSNAAHHGHTHDHNLRAAYIHVLADALTSVFAVAALAAGLLFGLQWLDPVVGIVGALVIASWAFGLIRDSGLVLLDAEADPARAAAIRTMVESEIGASVADLHLWRVGPGHHSLILSLVSPDQITAERVKECLRERYPDLSHVIVEVAVCAECPAPQP